MAAKAKPLTAAYRWAVASRCAAGFIGGYLLTGLAMTLLALSWPVRPFGVETGTHLSFAVYCAIVMWAFAVPRLRTVWLGIGVPTLVLAVAVWIS